MIDFDKKIVLIHPPRCGGSSIEDVLHGSSYFRDAPWLKHRSEKEYQRIIRLRGELPTDYTFYGLIREPIARMQSMFSRGYWHESVVFPHGIEKHLNGVGFSRFLALVKPASHEGSNLKLIDYFDGDVITQIHDLSAIGILAEELQIPLRHLQKSSEAKPKVSWLAFSILKFRFREDLCWYSGSIPTRGSQVIGMFVTVFFFAMHRTLWLLSRLKSPNSISSNLSRTKSIIVKP